jgi:hypothetical protein
MEIFKNKTSGNYFIGLDDEDSETAFFPNYFLAQTLLPAIENELTMRAVKRIQFLLPQNKGSEKWRR